MKKTTLRSRLALGCAAAGIMVMSSGTTVLFAAPAHAATPVNICHATGSDTNPYVFITVDDDSAKFRGHLRHRQDPNKQWKSDGAFNGVAHSAGDPKPDIIGDFTDDHGIFHAYDGVVTAATCNGEVEVAEAVADIDFTEPTCANQNEASYETTGEHVTFEETGGKAAPGATLEITATADDNFSFADGTATQVFTHTFTQAVDLDAPPCSGVVTPPQPPTVQPPAVTQVPVTPTVVHAGLTSPRDPSQKGLDLLVTGLLMLLGAGGIALTQPSDRRQVN